jgi:hypothetical protein
MCFSLYETVLQLSLTFLFQGTLNFQTIGICFHLVLFCCECRTQCMTILGLSQNWLIDLVPMDFNIAFKVC